MEVFIAKQEITIRLSESEWHELRAQGNVESKIHLGVSKTWCILLSVGAKVMIESNQDSLFIQLKKEVIASTPPDSTQIWQHTHKVSDGLTLKVTLERALLPV